MEKGKTGIQGHSRWWTTQDRCPTVRWDPKPPIPGNQLYFHSESRTDHVKSCPGPWEYPQQAWKMTTHHFIRPPCRLEPLVPV